MRIAVFVPSLRGGGAERVMLDLAHGFAERGITTDLVLPQVEGPYLSEVRSDVRIVNLKARRVLASLPALSPMPTWSLCGLGGSPGSPRG